MTMASMKEVKISIKPRKDKTSSRASVSSTSSLSSTSTSGSSGNTGERKLLVNTGNSASVIIQTADGARKPGDKNYGKRTLTIESFNDSSKLHSEKSVRGEHVKVDMPVKVNHSAGDVSERNGKQTDKNSGNTRNELLEKKISNLEREKMLGKSEKGVVHAVEDMNNSDVMEQEKKLDFDNETVQESDLEPEMTNGDSNELVLEPVPQNMMDELQKYLHKKFGPVLANNAAVDKETATDTASATGTATGVQNTNTEIHSSAESASIKHVPATGLSVLPHPIFFKTSIKKDPGSKLHDALLKELSVVMNKRNGVEEVPKPVETDKENSQGPRKPLRTSGNKVFGNKALLASLESQLQLTLHKNKIFQRQRLKVLDCQTMELDSSSPDISSPEARGDLKPLHFELKRSDSKREPGFIPPPPPPPPWASAGFLHKTPVSPVNREPDDELENEIIAKRKSLKHSNSLNADYEKKKELGEVFSSSDLQVSDSEVQAVMDKLDNSYDSFEKDDDGNMMLYAYQHPSGRLEGVICSVERRVSTRDSTGKPRKYLTCINIVAEKSDQEGCPFTQVVKDGGLPTASGPGLYFGEEDKPAHFDIDVGRRRGDLRVVVSGPNSMAKCSVEEKPGGVYAVTYIPVETGIFDVNVSWNGTDIPGSPYHPKVVDARKVKIIGGWQHLMDGNERVNLVVGERKQLPFDVSEAGPGTLRADVKGPTRSIDVDIDTHVMGRATVEFIPEEEGNHYIHLFWSDVPLANSPFLGYAMRAHADPSKLILTGRGLKEAVVREEAEFLIDGSQAGKGTPEVILSGVRAEVNVKTVPIGNGKFKCSYIAMVPGAYLLHITWNGRQLRGSPYKVNVIGAFYPNKVIVSGEGLKGGNLGRKMDVRIDTRKAGPGELTAYCMGPHQVAYCELDDNRDGTFQLGIKAQEPGRHVLQVKYSGEHVQGSPFIFKVTSQPDASKVRVTGPGVEHGILATYISRFTVETRGAGSGQLTVRIRGPKGGFQVEMYRDSQRDRTILCRYDPRECGLYIISIKWSGVDVPGSPFKVNIFDTQEELEQALTDTSYSIGTVNSGPPNSYRSVNGQEPPRLSYSKWRDNM